MILNMETDCPTKVQSCNQSTRGHVSNALDILGNLTTTEWSFGFDNTFIDELE